MVDPVSGDIRGDEESSLDKIESTVDTEGSYSGVEYCTWAWERCDSMTGVPLPLQGDLMPGCFDVEVAELYNLNTFPSTMAMRVEHDNTTSASRVRKSPLNLGDAVTLN